MPTMIGAGGWRKIAVRVGEEGGGGRCLSAWWAGAVAGCLSAWWAGAEAGCLSAWWAGAVAGGACLRGRGGRWWEVPVCLVDEGGGGRCLSAWADEAGGGDP
ncbi:hypothetical protein GCM10010397_33340 [Streptomyces spinoverrucosus]|nr:hypothetical protein GCM10010397_33340 [Streptomyces spinoverrucosus]